MLKPMKRSVAAVLVWLQIMMLLTVAAPQTLAVEGTAQSAQAAPAAAVMDAETEQQTPVLNPIIAGTVQFGTFNYTSSKGSYEAADYVMPFVYTDDYFAAPSYSSAVTDAVVSRGRTLDWTDLEDKSLATASLDFTMACYGSNEEITDVEDYKTDYDKNGKQFLRDCGFTAVDSNHEGGDNNYNQLPSQDSVGVIFGVKEITVWNAQTKQNETCKLVAIGVRGAGYGAEWASNLTIGDSETATLANSGTYRHKGFNDGAQMVLKDLKDYTNNMTGDVKYWVVGYSRSGAIANLVAGDITKNASTYKTSIDDVYGYTFEAAAGALKTEDPNGTKYPNIHNILNKMDAVPLVSPALFNHIRLGVDYYLPYYKFTGTNDANPIIETYYNNMYNTLKKVAVIADLYNGNVNQNRDSDGNLIDHTEDPTLTDANPDTYPYNKWIQISSFGILNYITNNGSLTSTVTNSKSKLTSGNSGLYMDEFLKQLVEAVMNSESWDVALSNRTTNWKSHEWQYVVKYQDGLRYLASEVLKKPGMGLGSFNNIMDSVLSGGFLKTAWETAGVGGAYTLLNGAAATGWFWDRTVNNFNKQLTDMVKLITSNMELFDDQSTADVYIESIMPPLTWLFSQDLRYYNSEYFGTLLDNVSTILVTHIPELGVSWLMSLDDVFISDYREITLPKNANISMYLFRPGIDDAYAKQIDAEGVNAAGEATGALVATVNGGTLLNSKDARITVKTDPNNAENIIIRYPGNLDIRFDVTATSDDVNVQLADYAPANVVNVYSTADRATTASADYNESNITDTHVVRDGIGENSVMTPDITQSAQDINTLSNGTEIPLKAGDTLQIMAWHGSNQVADSHDATYVINRIASKTCVVDFSGMTVAKNGTLKTSTASSASGEFKQNGNNVTYQLNAEKQDTQTTYSAYSSVDTASAYGTNVEGKYYYTESITAIPASSVYFDDSFATAPAFTSDGHGYSTDIDDQAVSKSAAAASGTFYYTFYGTGVDVYCTTDSESGYVSAAVFQTDDPTACSKDNRVGKAVTVSNKSSQGTRYNTPTISFTNLDGGADTYTLKIVANDNAKFKLDGVRVYNPVKATDDEGNPTAAAAKQAEVGEGNTLYLNLHDLLLNADQGFSVNPVTGMDATFDKSTISGVLFVDNAANLATESHYVKDPTTGKDVWQEEAVTLYQTQFDAYKTNSPNNEIYLSAAAKDEDGNDVTQAITFQVNTEKAPVGSTIYIGMSAPEAGSGSVTVTGRVNEETGKLDPLPVTSVMDMYYGITVPSDGLITITNVGDSLISLTNLKITNVQESRSISAMPANEKLGAMRAFFAPVTTETVELAAESLAHPVVTDAPDAPDTPDDGKTGWNDGADTVQAILKQLFRLLLQSLDTLFANVQTW